MGGFAAEVIQLERVRCLECGATYAKPAAAGTVKSNPGCPRCGYLGWIATLLPSTARRRFGAHRPPRLIAQPR